MNRTLVARPGRFNARALGRSGGLLAVHHEARRILHHLEVDVVRLLPIGAFDADDRESTFTVPLETCATSSGFMPHFVYSQSAAAGRAASARARIAGAASGILTGGSFLRNKSQ
jgi:hypothetical protein